MNNHNLSGFIDKQGNFYECNPSEYDKTSKELFGTYPEFLNGYIKIWRGTYRVIDGFAPYHMMATDEQLQTLVALGCKLCFTDFERWKNRSLKGRKR